MSAAYNTLPSPGCQIPLRTPPLHHHRRNHRGGLAFFPLLLPMNPPPPTDWQIIWDVLINIALLLFAFTGSFVAIVAKTWDKAERHVTILGWIAIICLFLTLAVGVTKEIRTQQKASQQEAENRKAQSESFRLQRLTFEETQASKDYISGLVNEVKSVTSELKALAAKRSDQSAPDVVKANQTAQTATQKAEQTKAESQARTAKTIAAALSPDDRAFAQ